MMLCQNLSDVLELSCRKSIVFSQFHCARAVQIKHRFTTRSDYMNMRRPVIVWIDHHPQSMEYEDRWHG